MKMVARCNEKAREQGQEAFPGTPFISKRKQFWIRAVKRMLKIKRAALPTTGSLFSVRTQALAGLLLSLYHSTLLICSYIHAGSFHCLLLRNVG